MAKTKALQQYTVQFLAECFSTCILILIGEAALANFKFARQTSNSTLPIGIAFGVGVYSAMMVGGPITGAHLNPAISIAFMTIRKLKPLQCIFYIIGQILGAFLGALLVYLVYFNQFNVFDGGLRQMIGPNGTADIFFTMPAKDIPQWNTFIDQVVSTGFLMIFVMALAYDCNHMISDVAKPFAFAIVVTAITCAFSINAGAAINPARDLGPRLFGAFVYGWNDVFHVHNYFFWIPIIGPIVGGILGAWIYTGYTWLIKHYGHFSNTEHTDADRKIDFQDIQTKYADDSYELQQKLTEVNG
ncbi:unnamed protein product [Rotaria sordida]|uniref:Aquaporin n=1 Tax=Rotaria sordida TaxID=392033 RepID=A0A815ZKV5_9BILA|nr:unnamed protein product [Rotaria sordida]CAF1584528.1 unnamed protein product [Rotaria sordida]